MENLMNNNSNHSKEKGQSMVELALSITVLLVILAGVVDLGNIFFQYMAMRDAAQEGASYASVYPGSCSNIEARVRADLHNADPSDIQIAILVDGVPCASATATNACSPKDVKVTVNQPNYELMMPLIGSFVGSQTINLKASIVNTILSPNCK
jgi:Flp pilus assembly protein TadG